MAIRHIERLSSASAIAGAIPELPRIGPELLDVPGMLEYDRALQGWWDQFKQSAVATQVGNDQNVREVKKTATSGDATLTARIATEETVRASADSALASRTTTLESQVQTPTTGLLARVTTIEGAYVDASGAYAQAVAAITAGLTGPSGDIYAAVQTEASARATADGYFASMYTLTAVAAGVIGGMKITAVSDPSGWTSYSEVRFQADRFTIYTGSTGLAPFQIVGSKIRFTGNVEIDGSLLLAGTLTVNYSDISGTKPPSDADKTESALITGTTITGGGITLSAGGSIKGGASNFSTGTGFFLGYEGGQYKFRVGNPAGARIEWDGSAWTVVSFPGAVPSYTLTLTPSTGNPLDNPSGGGSYTIGTRVNIVAPAMGTSGAFQRWSGSDPHVSMIDDPFSNNTYVTVIGDMGLIADYP